MPTPATIDTRHERLTLREIRTRAGWSMHRLAMIAGVSDATVRLFEAAPDAIEDREKRERLRQVYADLHQIVA